MRKTIRNVGGKSSNARLEQALDHVTANWLPPNSKNLQAIKDKIKSGQYFELESELVDDIKHDLGLFSYCVRHLREQGLDDENPLDLIAANANQISEHLATLQESLISSHNFHAMDRSQAVAVKNALLSMSSSELIANRAGIPSDQAFSCSSLRQVSLALISWNFPRIYAKAVQAAKEGRENMEASLARSLGFHPRVLAGALGSRLGFSDNVTKTAGTVAPTSLDALDLSSICEAGEIFAALHTPELSSSVAGRFEELETQIENLMGPQGFDVLRDHCASKMTSLVSLDPEVFKIATPKPELLKNGILDPSSNPEYVSESLLKNPFVARCPEELQQLFRSVYQFVVIGQPSPQALQVLVGLLIPKSGFPRGCVFLADDVTRSLSPKLRIGTDPISRYASGGDTREAMGMLGEALMCSTPLRERNVVMFGEIVSFISGNIGSHKRVGVLYLEMSNGMAQRSDDEALTIFKAIRKCLSDCLAVGT